MTVEKVEIISSIWDQSLLLISYLIYKKQSGL